jgi:hypothetical protein
MWSGVVALKIVYDNDVRERKAKNKFSKIFWRPNFSIWVGISTFLSFSILDQNFFLQKMQGTVNFFSAYLVSRMQTIDGRILRFCILNLNFYICCYFILIYIYTFSFQLNGWCFTEVNTFYLLLHFQISLSSLTPSHTHTFSPSPCLSAFMILFLSVKLRLKRSTNRWLVSLGNFAYDFWLASNWQKITAKEK